MGAVDQFAVQRHARNLHRCMLGTLHRAKMTGLLRNTVYYYRVGNTLEKNGWSSVFSFKTLDPNTSSLNILVFGDMAYDINSDNTILNGIAAVQVLSTHLSIYT